MSRNSLEYRQPLLDGSRELSDPEKRHSFGEPSTTRNVGHWRRNAIIAILVASLALNTGFIVNVVWRHAHKAEALCLDQLEWYSPAREAVVYEKKKFTRARGRTPYHGPPSDAVDAAWDDLYKFGVSKIPKTQAALMVNRTIPLETDPNTYVVQLDVFHHLHCLNMVRKALHPERYKMYEPPSLLGLGPFDHIDHCLNGIRESLMCSADITPNTWLWEEKYGYNIPRIDTVHTCRDFEKIKDWAEARHINSFDKSVHSIDDLEFPVIY